MQILRGIGGMAAVLLLAFALSTNRRAVKPRTVIGALAIQFAFGFLVLYSEIGQRALEAVSNVVGAVMNGLEENDGASDSPAGHRNVIDAAAARLRTGFGSP